MEEELIEKNLVDVNAALGNFVHADREESVVVEKQLLQLARLEGIVNVARPFIKTYTYYVQNNPELPSCLLQLMQCYPDQTLLESSCQAVVIQYVNVMTSLQAFVERNGVWAPNIQNAFVNLYDAVNTYQFATLLTLMDKCQQRNVPSGCTSEITDLFDKLIHGNTIVANLATKLLTQLENAAVSTNVTKLFKKCYEWNSNLFFYIGSHVLAPLVGLATGVDWRNLEKAKWYTLFYASVKGFVDEFANSQVAQLFVHLFKPPELRMKLRFNFFNPIGYAQTVKGFALYYLDYLSKWNESLTRYVQSHYVHPLLERALLQWLSKARNEYIPTVFQPVLAPLVDVIGKLHIPDIANSLSYLIVTIVLPTLLPYMAYFARVGVDKFIKLMEKQVKKDTRDMQYIVSRLPPSPVASVQRGDEQKLLFLDKLVESNKRFWPYRTLKWFIGLMLKDAKKAEKRRVLAYKCVRPRRLCIPVFADTGLEKGALYFRTQQRCKQKC